MAEFVVDTTADEVADDARLSLREAVAQANASPEADRIVFASGPGEAFEGGGTIRLVQGAITIAGALEIDGDLDGDGGPDVTISADAAGDDLTDAQGFTDIEASAGEGRLADNTRLFDVTDPDGAVTLRGLALTGGAVSDPGEEGGAVRTLAPLTLAASHLVGNAAMAPGAGGGAVWASFPQERGKALTILDSRVEHNRSGGDGAGVDVYGGTVEILRSSLSHNRAGSEGAALYVNEGYAVVIRDSVLDGNAAPNNSGGAVYFDARGETPGVYEMIVADSRLSGNTARGDGGAIEIADGALLVLRSEVLDNRAQGPGTEGGGIYVRDIVTVIDSRVAGNRSGGDGGGINQESSGGRMTVIRSEIVDNVAGDRNFPGDGGGLLAGGGPLFLVSSLVAGNSVLPGQSGGGGEGGGIRANEPAVIVASTIAGNSAPGPGGEGGGIFSDESLTLVNVTVAGNRADEGAGVFVQRAGEIVNSTLTGNLAGSAGGGVFAFANTTLGVANSLVLGNANDAGANDLEGDQTFGGASLDTTGGGNLFGAAPAGFDMESLGGGDAVIDGADAAALSGVFAMVGPDPATGVTAGLLGDVLGPVPVAALAGTPGNPAVDTGEGAAPLGIFEGTFDDLDGDGTDGETLAFSEALIGADLNGDGDRDDLFATVADLLADARGLPRLVDGDGLDGAAPDLGAVERQAEAPGLTVTTTADVVDPADGETSLREAVGFVASGAFGAGSTISFDPLVFDGGAEDVIRLTLGELAIPVSLTIDGNLNDDLVPDVVISGDAAGDDTAPDGITDVAASAGALSDNSRVISTAAGTEVTLDGLVITGGRTEGDAPMFFDSSQGGAGIRALGDLVLRNATVAGNSTTGENADGAGVFAGADLTVTDSTISGNIASGENSEGGGIRSRGDLLEVTGSAFRDNVAGDQGGGLYAYYGASVADSVFSGNHSGLGGGGLFALAEITISGTEFTGNRMEGNGSGAAGATLFSGGTILDSTISGNVAGTVGTGGIDGSFDTLTILRSTVSDNVGAGSYESGGITGGRLVVIDSTVSGNRIEADGARGGGISALFVTAVNVTVADNTAEGEGARGGGVFVFSGADLVQSTLTGNRASGADAQGGGVFDVGGDRPLMLANSLSLGNAAEGVGASAPELATGGTLAFAGLNLVGADAAAFDPAGHAGVANADPAAVFALAEPLAANGGPVGTAALAAVAANPALDAADPGVALGIAERGGGDLDGDGVPGEILDFSEALVGVDLNGDGDTGDVFATVADLWSDARGLPRDVDLPGAGGTPDLGAFELQITTIAAEAVDADRGEGDAGETPFTFRVTRTGETGGALELDYAVAGSGAAPADAADFAGGALPSGVLSFAPGEDVAEIAVLVAGDMAVEADEGFELSLSDPGGLIETGAPVAGTIRDDDAPAVLSIAATLFAVQEGDSGTTEMIFTVTRSGNTGIAAEAAFAVVGTGVAPVDAEDFGGTLPAGTVAFAPGETEREIVLLVSGDTDLEPDERFEVRLSDPSAGTEIAKDDAVGLIRNDEPVAVFDIAALDAVRAEGDAGASAFTFTVTRTGSTAGEAAVSYLVSGTGADPAGARDFVGAALPEGRIDFADGEDSARLTVEVAGDGVIEPDEGFEVDIQPIVGGSIGTGTATASILNDDVFGPVAPSEGVIRGTGRDDAIASGAGAIYLPRDGADIFLVSEAAAAGETGVIDASAGDLVQLAGGLEIVGVVLTPDAVQLDLATGGRVQVLNADLATFEPGGNVTTGAAGPELSYGDFAEQVLGVAAPASGVATGGAATVPEATGTDPVAPVAGAPAPPEGVIRGTDRADTLLTGAGAIVLPRGGDDTLVVSQAATPGETSVVEGEAGDLIQLVAGLEIAEALLTPTALALTLATGAAVQILEADALLFEPGGNATTGDTGPTMDYATFADAILGAPVPDSGVTTVGPATIPDASALAADAPDFLA